ncbi:MAG TPA: hypothetical protein VGL09_09435 [Methylomirabilota bacterium]|jgi:hypothetical protein
MRSRIGIAIVQLAILLSAAATAAAQNYGISGAERYFRVEAEGIKSKRWGPEVGGYIYNDYGSPATNVRLLIEGQDASGATVTTVVAPIVGVVPGNNRLYFEVRVPAADTYRVRVLSWDFIRGGGAM